MVPVKQNVQINFSQGLDLKTDPWQVPIGKFLGLENSIFTKGGLLQKRNGFGQLSTLPNINSTYLTTFNGNLTAIGNTLSAYNEGNTQWVNKGNIQPVALNTLPLVRNNANQQQADVVIASNNLGCVVYTEYNGSTTTYKYAIFDSVTGQNIVTPVAIPVGSGAVTGSPRVFLLGNYFVIVFTNVISGTSHLQYISISVQNPTTVTANHDIASAYISKTTLSWDGFVANNNLYVAYNTTTGGQAIKVTYLTSSAAAVGGGVAATVTFAGQIATMVSVTADITNPASPTIYVSYYDLAGTTGYVLAVNPALSTVMNPLEIIASGTILNITSAAQNGTVTVYYEVSNNYSYDSSIPSHYINAVSVTPLGLNFHSHFSSGAATITASSATGLVNGMYIIDNTTSANITPGTTFTISGTTLSLSNNTAGNSAALPGDVMTTATVSSAVTIIRSVGLASKAFIVNGVEYFLSAYQSSYQPSYYLINGTQSLASSPVIVSALAYSNGGGYLTIGLPSALVTDTTVQIAYLYKDLISAVNKNTNVPAGTQVNGIYSQTGVNMVSFDLSTAGLDSAEIGQNLNLSGGFLWNYDGINLVENNFFVWPDNVELTQASSGGGMLAQQYFYQVTYEWTDNQGNAYRSAPSIPVSTTVVAGSGLTFDSVFSSGVSSITVSSATGLHVGQVITDTTTSGNITAGTYITSISGTTIGLSVPTAGASTTTPGDVLQTVNQGEVTVDVPYLRLTYKVRTPVKIVIYRWSTAQQIYYQVTSITQPTLNVTTSDSVAFVDKLNDAEILGNNIIYTNGGVVENVSGPASNLMTLFDDRLWLVDAEDQNLLWYSKQVIETTPVEMSDLFTMYIAPSTAAQGSTGVITAIAPLDDKIIIFKRNALYYVNGTGPDNTGANSQYSQPIFITSTVGCANQQSIVFMPQGLMFQSDKGIWLLGRDMSTTYIGAPVENFTTTGTVLSAVNVPGTNQVRFTLDSGVTLMYDYYFGQWGTFVNIPGISSTLYQGLHTYITDFGQVFQETPGSYLDGSTPVLLSFTTGWINPAGLQGYMRSYCFFLLGQYLSPHKLNVQVAYDYNPAPQQSYLITPTNFSPAYGAPGPYGQGNPYGGEAATEDWRVFLAKQRCQSFQVILNEVYDPSMGVPAGAGLTLSGLNLVIGRKAGWRTISSSHTAKASS